MPRTILISAVFVAAVAFRAAAAETTPDASAPEAGAKVTLILNGLFGPLTNGYDESRTIHMFAEDGMVESSYSAKGGLGGELALQYRLKPRLAIMLGATYVSGSAEDEYSARLPHPLYLNKHRVVEGTLEDLAYSEAAGHLSLAYVRDEGKTGYSLFAGPSFYQVSTEIVSRVDTTEAYPYDEVSARVVTETLDNGAPGFHVGASLLHRLSPKLALGLQARYGFATVKLSANASDKETKVNAGGLLFGLGLRFGL